MARRARAKKLRVRHGCRALSARDSGHAKGLFFHGAHLLLLVGVHMVIAHQVKQPVGQQVAQLAALLWPYSAACSSARAGRKSIALGTHQRSGRTRRAAASHSRARFCPPGSSTVGKLSTSVARSTPRVRAFRARISASSRHHHMRRQRQRHALRRLAAAATSESGALSATRTRCSHSIFIAPPPLQAAGIRHCPDTSRPLRTPQPSSAPEARSPEALGSTRSRRLSATRIACPAPEASPALLSDAPEAPASETSASAPSLDASPALLPDAPEAPPPETSASAPAPETSPAPSPFAPAPAPSAPPLSCASCGWMRCSSRSSTGLSAASVSRACAATCAAAVGLMAGVFDALVEHAVEHRGEGLADARDVAQGQRRVVQLAVVELAAHELGDELADLLGRGVVHAAHGGLHGIGQHDDGAFLALGLRPS